ncbi:MAG: GNAT family N-acetyltransferase [Scytolyngbya sp. HA4215-MV1]|nr:GNAT family N-acetyltransferase [Scytolyngbya sp. HA4215-MV1]
MNDRDRLTLRLIPNNPQHLLSRLPINLPVKTILTLFKIRDGVVFTLFVTIVLTGALSPAIAFSIVSDISINVPWVWVCVWVGIGWLILLGSSIRFFLTSDDDWHQFCWVVEYQEQFVAYGVLRPYHHYSILEFLHVHHKWARKGIGSALVKTLTQNAVAPIYVESAIRVVGFYKRLGFRKIKFKELPRDVQQHFNFRGAATLLVYEGIQND